MQPYSPCIFQWHAFVAHVHREHVVKPSDRVRFLDERPHGFVFQDWNWPHITTQRCFYSVVNNYTLPRHHDYVRNDSIIEFSYCENKQKAPYIVKNRRKPNIPACEAEVTTCRRLVELLPSRSSSAVGQYISLQDDDFLAGQHVLLLVLYVI